MKTFEESQKFNRTIFFVLIPICLLVCGIAFWQITTGHKVGNHPAPNFVNVILAIIVTILTYTFYSIKLETQISETGIKYQFRSFFKYGGNIEWSAIKSIRFMKYPYLGEGVRIYKEKNAIAYVTQNKINQGIMIEPKDGTRNILISSAQMPALKDFIKSLNPAGIEIIED